MELFECGNLRRRWPKRTRHEETDSAVDDEFARPESSARNTLYEEPSQNFWCGVFDTARLHVVWADRPEPRKGKAIET